jgi:hypothetical protein
MLPAYLVGAPALLDPRFPLPLDAPFTTRESAAEGVTPKQLTRLVRDGFLRRPIKGVYLASQIEETLQVRAEVICKAVPPGSVVTDWTACWYWTGVDRPGSHLEVPRLDVFKHRGHDRLRNGLVRSGERWLLPSDLAPLDGNVSITRPIRTAWDLGRLTPRIIAIGGMDALCRVGDFEPAELVDGVERFRRQRGVVQLRGLAPLVDPRAESVGESAVRLRWDDCSGLPAPQLQIPVYDDTGTLLYRLDLGVEELRLGVEYDGVAWHSSDEDREHDERRRTALEDAHGYCIDVFRREHVFGQHEIVSWRLPQAVREARSRLSNATMVDLAATRAQRWRT